MKVQHKETVPGRQLKVLAEAGDFYVLEDPSFMCGYFAAKKADYEPVEEWVDVNMSTLTFDESMDDAYLCDGGRILFKRTAWANGKGHGAPTDVYRITGLQRKVKR